MSMASTHNLYINAHQNFIQALKNDVEKGAMMFQCKWEMVNTATIQN